MGFSAISSFEMNYPKELTLLTGFELDSRIDKKNFTLLKLDCKHSLVKIVPR